MDTQKLHDLIDKVIGKTGPLRTPAWWMRRVLLEVEGCFSKVGIAIDAVRRFCYNEILNLESRMKVMVANCLKSTPEYTYAELKQLSDTNKLIPGQKYILTDYRLTVSLKDDKLGGSVYASDSFGHITLTAKSTSSFYQSALLYHTSNNAYNVEVLYYFYRTSGYAWCLGASEVQKLTVEHNGENVELEVDEYDRDAFGNQYLKYKTKNGESFGKIPFNTSLKVGKEVRFTSNAASSFAVKVVSFEDPYRGIIVRYYDPVSCVELPCDPNVTMDFSIELYGAESKQIINKKIVSLGTKNTVIKPYYYKNNTNNQSHYAIPRIAIYGGTLSGYKYIGNNCTNIRIGNEPESQGSFKIDDNCKHIFMYDCGDIHIPSNSSNLLLHGSHAVFHTDSGVSNVTLHSIGNVEFHGYCNNTRLSAVNKAVSLCVFSVNNHEIVFEQDGVYFIAKDSNGNIRQWNPADYVDAIDEPVTTEEE